jgi:hypothetical protein
MTMGFREQEGGAPTSESAGKDMVYVKQSSDSFGACLVEFVEDQ